MQIGELTNVEYEILRILGACLRSRTYWEIHDSLVEDEVIEYTRNTRNHNGLVHAIKRLLNLDLIVSSLRNKSFLSSLAYVYGLTVNGWLVLQAYERIEEQKHVQAG